MKLRSFIEILMLGILSTATVCLAFLYVYNKAPVHDIAVLYVSPDLTSNRIVGIIENNGSQIESFNTTAYCNDSAIGSEPITDLPSHAFRTVNFTWNTLDLPAGSYVVRVVASNVQDENDTSNNSKNSTVLICAEVSISNAYLHAGNIVATARNDGYKSADFDVTAYCNGSFISTEAVIRLRPKMDRVLYFPFDARHLPNVTYNFTVVASITPRETNRTDNHFEFFDKVGFLYSAAQYFNFTSIAAEASMVGSGEVQIRSLSFNITANIGDVHKVMMFINGMTEPVSLRGIFNQTSERIDVDFQIPYQTRMRNNFYPVNMTISGEEIDPAREEVTLLVPPMNGSSYTIWRGGDRYYAKNDWSQIISLWGANFTYVFQQTLKALPENGGTINLETGFYEGWLVVNRSGVTVQGQSIFCDNPKAMPNGTRKLPDDSPGHLMGTVLLVNGPGHDGIHLKGQLTGVQIKNLGIEFTKNITGNGISDDMDQTYHVSYSIFENIMILNHDKSHYAIQMSNFLHNDFRDVWSWGGPLLNLYGNMSRFQFGNSNFYNVYGYVKYDVAPIDFVSGPYPIFIHKNDSLDNVWANLLHFYRIQINCPFPQSDPDFCVFTLWDCRLSTFDGVDLEGSGNGYEGHKLMMGSCYNNQFSAAFMWSMANNLYVNVASNNYANTFENCWISSGTLLDSCSTDEWRGSTIDAAIHSDSKALFFSLPGNYGTATLTAGSIEVNITAKFIGTDYSIVIQPTSNASLTYLAYPAPYNFFTVKCADKQPAREDIVFRWWVQPPQQPP